MWKQMLTAHFMNQPGGHAHQQYDELQFIDPNYYYWTFCFNFWPLFYIESTYMARESGTDIRLYTVDYEYSSEPICEHVLKEISSLSTGTVVSSQLLQNGNSVDMCNPRLCPILSDPPSSSSPSAMPSNARWSVQRFLAWRFTLSALNLLLERI
jgi:hypothetical protein